MKKHWLSIISCLLLPCLFFGCTPSGGGDVEKTKEPGENPVEPSPTPKVYSDDPIVSAELFQNPTAEYRGLQMAHETFQNSSVNAYNKDVKNYLNRGFGGIVTNDAWNKNYLSNDKQLERMGKYVKAAKEEGLRVWIYDEYGFPSGSANTLTVGSNRELQAQAIEQITVKGTGAVKTTVNLPKDFNGLHSARISTDGIKFENMEVTVNDKEMTFTGIEGSWTAYLYPIRYIDCCYGNEYASYPNLLDAAAVKAFIDCTYETYAKTIENFGDVVEAFFTDEPAVLGTRCICNGQIETCPCIPYEKTMFERFQKEFGYDLTPLLPQLFVGMTDESKRARAQFYYLVGEMLAENFIGQIQNWCEAHGVKLSGHLNNEEYMWYHVPMYGNYMLVERATGYKGFDVLDLRPKQYLSATSIGAKYATSASWLTNNGRVLVEICPVTDVADFEKDDLNYSLGSATFIYFDGGNQIGSYYPQANVLAKTGKAYNEYVGRMGTLTVDAKNLSNVAIYYGIDTISANFIAPNTQSAYSIPDSLKANDRTVNDIVSRLRAKGLDYVFLDDIAFAEGKVTDSSFSVAGFDFTTIIVPSVEIININTLRVLNELVKKGVNVIFVKRLPRLSFTGADQAELTEIVKGLADVKFETVVDAMKAVTTTAPITVESAQTIYVSPWEKGDKRFFFLANATEKDADLKVSLAGYTKFRVYDPVAGTITESDGTGLKLAAYRALFVQPIAG